MTTTTFIKQLKKWLNGTLKPSRLLRNRAVVATKTAVQRNGPNSPILHFWTTHPTAIDRFASYKEKIIPKLQSDGYLYFRSASSNEYQMHEEWCHEHCGAPTLPHCDVWQFDAQYPRAFRNETDAMMFAMTFDSTSLKNDH